MMKALQFFTSRMKLALLIGLALLATSAKLAGTLSLGHTAGAR